MMGVRSGGGVWRTPVTPGEFFEGVLEMEEGHSVVGRRRLVPPPPPPPPPPPQHHQGKRDIQTHTIMILV